MNEMPMQKAEILIEEYGNSVYRFALSIMKQKELADDVFQEVFLRYMKRQPMFENKEHAKAWFLVVTKNCCRNYFMSAYFRRKIPLEKDFPMLEKRDYGLYEEVMKLPLKYRKVLHLYYYEGFSTDEIASLLQIPSASVRTRLKRGRERLKMSLERSDYFENV